MPSKEKLHIGIDYSKGLTPYSGTLVPLGGSPDLDQVENYRGHIRRAMGINPFSAAVIADELPCLLQQYFVTSGTTYLQFISDTKAYQYSLAGDSWTSKGTHAAKLTTENNPDLFISGTVAEDLHIITDGVNPIRKALGVGSYANLGGLLGGTPFTTFTAECLVYFKTYLLLANTTEEGTVFPYRVRRSDTADVETYEGDNNSGYNDLSGATDVIKIMRELIDRVIIYRSNSIWDCIYVGYPDIFYFTPRIKQTSLLARKSLISHMTFHVGLFTESISLFDGSTLHDITGDLRPILFGANSEMNMQYAGNSVGAYVSELNEYWLAIPLGVEEYPTQIFRYHVPSKTWWKKGTGMQFYCSGKWDENTAATWDSVGTATTTWDEIIEIWDSKTLGAGQELILWGSDNDAGGDAEIHKIDYSSITDNGVVKDAFYTTKDYKFSARERWNSIWVECKGSGSVTVEYSSDEGVNWTSLGSQTTPNNFAWLKFWLNVTLEKCRFKITFPEADFHMRAVIAYYRERVQ